MPQDAQMDVLAFHRKFGHMVADEARELKDIPYVNRMFRVERIEEESKELVAAIRFGDTAHSIQEAMDLIYVVLGFLVELGVPVQPMWDAVHSANMEKVPSPLGKLGKPEKPLGWESPKRRIYMLFQDMLLSSAEDKRRHKQHLAAELCLANAVIPPAEVDMNFPLPKPPVDDSVPPGVESPTGVTIVDAPVAPPVVEPSVVNTPEAPLTVVRNPATAIPGRRNRR